LKIIKHGLKFIYGDMSFMNETCPECITNFAEFKFEIISFQDATAPDGKPGYEVRYTCKICGCQWVAKRLIMEKNNG